MQVYVFAYAFFFASRPLSDGDFWWHLRTGEFIVRNHSIPRTDPFSFSNFGKPWVAHEWLSDLIFYLVYSHFGFNTLIFVFAVLTAVAFLIVFVRCNAHAFVGVFATLLATSSVLTTVGVRPRAFTLLFASFYLLVLTRYTQGRESKPLWLLVPVMALWVNLHAGFLIGLVLIAVTTLGVFMDGLMEGKALMSAWPSVKKLLLVLAASCGAVLLNPQGIKIFLFPFEFFFSPVQQNQIDDWLSPNFHLPEFLPLALLILGTTAALALSPTRPKISEMLLFLSTLYATLKSNRHVAIFALVAAPLLANYLQSWIESTTLKKSFGRDRSERPDRASIFFAVLVLIPLVALTIQLKKEIYSPPRQERVGVPLQAVAFMKAQNLTGRTFTDPNIWSGYLIWEMPQNPVFIDGRIDMYGDDFVKHYIKIISGAEDWENTFDQYQMRVAIISPSSVLRLSMQKSTKWQQTYSDEMAVVFARR